MAKRKYFPGDLTREILLRLPVKSLQRFKSLSKTWGSEITTPSFNKSHLTNQSAKLAPKIVMERYDKVCIADINSGDALVFDTNSPVLLRGSCNGLLCFTTDNPLDENQIIVCNMLTNDRCYIKPPPAIKLLHNKRALINGKEVPTSCGFGYDSINDDYKVVLISSSLSVKVKEVQNPVQTAAWIYSLRKKSWKEIEINPHLFKCALDGVFLHGSLHWSGITGYGFNNDPDRQFVVAIDMEKGTFYEVSVPEEGRGFCKHLGVYRGCLKFERGDQPNNVWIMKDYMVKESWTKLCSSSDQRFRKLNGNAWTSDHRYLVQVEGPIPYLYDSETTEFYRVREINGFPWRRGNRKDLDIHDFIETLVSVSDYGESTQREEVSNDSHLGLIQRATYEKVELETSPAKFPAQNLDKVSMLRDMIRLGGEQTRARFNRIAEDIQKRGLAQFGPNFKAERMLSHHPQHEHQ